MLTATSSVTVIAGAALSFESVGATDAASAPLRLREHHDTLLRVVAGVVTLEVDGAEQVLGVEGEALIKASAPHRLWNSGVGEARVVQEFRRTS
jgi:mannose-6-phosphate isomerase-like protein (cupin superfamily)